MLHINKANYNMMSFFLLDIWKRPFYLFLGLFQSESVVKTTLYIHSCFWKTFIIFISPGEHGASNGRRSLHVQCVSLLRLLYYFQYSNITSMQFSRSETVSSTGIFLIPWWIFVGLGRNRNSTSWGYTRGHVIFSVLLEPEGEPEFQQYKV